MRIKALRNFYQNGRFYQTGQEYEVTDITVNRAYYEILSVEPAVKPKSERKRPKVAAMEPSEVRKTVVRRK